MTSDYDFGSLKARYVSKI